MSLHLYLNGGRQSMDGGSKGALGLLRKHCKLNGLKIDQYDNYTGGYHLRPDSHWTYSFDGRGQVTGARKRTVTNVSTGAAFLLGGWDAAYSYDDIGNRTTFRFGGDGQESSPVGSEEVAYEVNALNQYTEIETPRAFFVTGSAPAASSVGITLNGVAANRAVPHFWARQEVAGTGPTWADATLVATSGSSTVTVPKHTYVPPAVETPSYDADGNLVADSRWLYAWDGENQLKEMTTQVVAVSGGVPDLRLTFAYDGQSRRIRKLVEEKVSGVWVTRTDTRFVYDGWNLMAEVEYLGTAPDVPPATSAAPRPFLRRTYLWGQDLSGSLQGAGGVGGLLAITRHEHGAVPSKDYWVTSDLNGNVIGLINENGLRALYEYDPFGKPLRVGETEERLNPFRFSTKYTDAETGLNYYGYRYYDAVRGRWINRDPIEERGGLNLYGMVGNDGINRWDYLGLDDHHWFMRLGGTGQMQINRKFPKICLNIDRYTTTIDGGNIGSPHSWVHGSAFDGIGCEKVYKEVLESSTSECQFLSSMYVLMNLVHRLLMIEQELGRFTSGGYDAKSLELHPYTRVGSTLGEYQLLMWLHCSDGKGSPVPIVKELERQTQKFERDMLFYRLYPFEVFAPKSKSFSGECYPGARSNTGGPSCTLSPLGKGIIMIGGAVILGVATVVATVDPLPGDEVAAGVAATALAKKGVSEIGKVIGGGMLVP